VLIGWADGERHGLLVDCLTSGWKGMPNGWPRCHMIEPRADRTDSDQTWRPTKLRSEDSSRVCAR